jgi:F-type H+-transporting ATPase subunit a
LVAAPAYGSTEEGLNVYGIIAHQLGLSVMWQPILASCLVTLAVLSVGLVFRAWLKAVYAQPDPVPTESVGLMWFVEMAMELVHGIAVEQCGHFARVIGPVLAGIFMFVLFSNLSGLIPGFPPATENFSTNLALGFLVFLLYNGAGFAEHGFMYLKQFAGPVLALSPIFIVLEVVSHGARPLSLAFRLMANIFGDHLLLGVFSSLVPLGIPVLFMFFGLLVAVIQSFVFTLLTGIYINMAISHDH